DFNAVNGAQNGTITQGSNRIDPRFNRVALLESSASSSYHGLELFAMKSYAKGFYIHGGYTFSKSIDNGSDPLGVLINDSFLPQNPRNIANDRAVSQFDIQHRVVIAHTWEPTWGAGVSNPALKKLASGWGFTGISSFRSGFPVTF